MEYPTALHREVLSHPYGPHPRRGTGPLAPHRSGPSPRTRSLQIPLASRRRLREEIGREPLPSGTLSTGPYNAGP